MPNNKSNPTTTRYANSKFILRYLTNVGNSEILSVDTLPQTIEEAGEDILNKAILCEKSNRPFRITSSELEFYQRMKLPLPNLHPLLRMEQRLNLVKNGKKYKTICAKCKKEILSAYSPDRPEIVYCETCYQQEVY